MKSVNRRDESGTSKKESLSRANKYRIGFALVVPVLVVAFQNCAPMSGFEVAAKNSASSGSGETDPSGSGDPGSGNQPGPGGTLPSLPPPVGAGGTVTDIKVQNLASSAQSNVPFTFGQVFPPGALLKTETLAGKLPDGSLINLQVEAKATHADGSVRHAVVTGVLPSLGALATETILLIKASGSSTSSPVSSPQALLNSGFGAVVTVNLGGTIYTASANEPLAANKYKSWLSGPYVNEFLVVAPLKTSSGVVHPHLSARFDIRAYTGLNKARVDVILENAWSYEPAPQNFTYNVQVHVGGQLAYSKSSLKHYHHARWKKTFWWGANPNVHLKHNVNYLIQSRALPNYDQSVLISDSTLAGLQNEMTPARAEPMAFGIAQPYMPMTGGRLDLGLNPGWAVSYLLTQDVRAKNVTLTQADLSGSWSMHYRDKLEDHPHSIVDYPYSGKNAAAGDKFNPVTKQSEAFPECTGDCDIGGVPDTSHSPNFAYIPYLVTGDHYYLEELLFWAGYVVHHIHPTYREFEKGIVKEEQLRGQGWAIRLLGEAGYITPDNHPLKSDFKQIVNHNLDYYNTNYTNNPNANSLGVITNGYTIEYNSGRGIAPWQDDFFTQAIGHLVDMGYAKAEPLLLWKAKFQISRMTAPGFCWTLGAMYSMNIRDSASSPFYTSMAKVYEANTSAELRATACGSAEMAVLLSKIEESTLPAGSMTGYPTSNAGMPSNYQPALAYAATSGAPDGMKAWDIFSKRTLKPIYSDGAQFAIVPRR